jgi:hypothetical protein
MDWVETLPSQCPPVDAVPPEGVYYRAVSADCTEDDFVPYARLYPMKKYTAAQACNARALSIFSDVEDCLDAMKLPSLQKLGQTCVAKITLTAKDGMISKGRQPNSHYSWWRTRDFDLNTSVEPINVPAI